MALFWGYENVWGSRTVKPYGSMMEIADARKNPNVRAVSGVYDAWNYEQAVSILPKHLAPTVKGMKINKEKTKSMTYMERMNECKSTDEARAILADFEAELHGFEITHNLKPNVGQVEPNFIVGFCVIKPKEWQKYVKEARKNGLSEDDANELIALIAQGKDLHTAFESFLANEIEETVDEELTAKEKADKLIDEKAPVVIRETIQTLQVVFTAKEKNQMQSDLILALQEKSKFEDEKSSSASMYAAKIKERAAKVELLITQISTGFENRQVNCEWRLNFPDAGKKTLFRLDTKEIVEEKEMLPADRQLVLDDVRDKQGKTERNLDEKEITDADPEDDESEFSDEGGEEGGE